MRLNAEFAVERIAVRTRAAMASGARHSHARSRLFTENESGEDGNMSSFVAIGLTPARPGIARRLWTCVHEHRHREPCDLRPVRAPDGLALRACHRSQSAPPRCRPGPMTSCSPGLRFRSSTVRAKSGRRAALPPPAPFHTIEPSPSGQRTKSPGL